jgi:hypothetical protein
MKRQVKSFFFELLPMVFSEKKISPAGHVELHMNALLNHGAVA